MRLMSDASKPRRELLFESEGIPISLEQLKICLREYQQSDKDIEGFQVGLVLLASHFSTSADKFLMRHRDEELLARATGVPLDKVFGIAVNLIQNGIWNEHPLDVDDGITLGMAINAGLGYMQRLGNDKWKMTEAGERYAAALAGRR